MAFRVNIVPPESRRGAWERLMRELDPFCAQIDAIAKADGGQNPYTQASKLNASAASIRSLIQRLVMETTWTPEEFEKTSNMVLGALAATRFLLDHMRASQRIAEPAYVTLARHRDAMVRIVNDQLQAERAALGCVEAGSLEVR